MFSPPRTVTRHPVYATGTALDSAFSRIYGVSAPAPLLAQLRDAVLVLGAVVAAIGVTVGLAAVVPLGVALNVVLGGSVRDRQLQQGALRETDQRATMSEADGPTDDESDADGSTDTASTDDGSGAGGSSDERAERSEQPGTGPRRDPARRADLATKDELNELRQEIDAFEEEIEGRTVHREELEDDLEQYVRRQVQRGHARGWGPYLVLLYGTVMTVGAFYFLGGGWAILAMLVVWLSTLGLYTLMVLVGLASAAIGVPGRVVDRLRNLR
jgi:membrane protein